MWALLPTIRQAENRRAFHATNVDDFPIPPWDCNVAPQTMQAIIHAGRGQQIH